MAATDKTRISKPSPIKENDQGQLVAKKGVSREVLAELSRIKGEPDWMRDKRLKSFEIFERKPIPTWGVDLSDLDLTELVLYSPPEAGRYDSWDDVPQEQKDTFEKLGIPHADHRRRGLRRELHRGLHCADVQRQLDALRCRRDLRQGGCEGSLHDRAELVEGRVQPEHEARDRRGARHRRMGRRLDGR